MRATPMIGDRPITATRPLRPPPAIPAALLVPLSCAVFLLVVAFGSPPQALGLDASWTEVLAWGFLHHAQWGRDLVFTYGPLGFLHPYASYVTGIFPWFVAGQIALAMAFALTFVLVVRRSSVPQFVVFLLVLLCCCSRLSGDVSWALTPFFASACLIDCLRRRSTRTFVILALLLAPIFAIIALIKFSLFPLWAVCVATLTAASLFERGIRFALLILATFVAALFLIWFACGQQLQSLPAFLSAGLEVASGYRHAMGVRAPFWADLVGFLMLCAFVALCVFAAVRARSDRSAAASALMPAAAAVLFWLAFFTRADDFHWPGFFTALAFLPIVLLRDSSIVFGRPFGVALAFVALLSAIIAGINATPSSIARYITIKPGENLHDLTHLSDLLDQRESEWASIAASVALPRIRERIGDARVDMLTWEQGVILLNGFNYAPRPVFQSYSAYTPRLARLNEGYFIGTDAPRFVVFRLDYSDNKVPMSEDGLALIALLRRYRPTLVEKGFLLLQREDAPVGAAIEPGTVAGNAALNSDTAIALTTTPTIAFINVELNAFGRIYTTLFREPDLDIVLTTEDNQRLRYRFTRPSAAAGFLLNPLVRSTQDWMRVYFSRSLPRVRSISIDTESSWERYLFQPDFAVALKPIEVLHADPSQNVSALADMLYPGFNVAPLSPASVRVIDEDGKESVYLHAPAALTFMPEPGNYSIRALFGIEGAALSDPTCIKADPNGIGISLVLIHAGTPSVRRHIDIDPFHAQQHRGPQKVSLASIDVVAGDSVEYRVDAGPGGNNVSCDWSYVRDFVFERRGDPGKIAAGDRIFVESFD
jgi:hypothetical protein